MKILRFIVVAATIFGTASVAHAQTRRGDSTGFSSPSGVGLQHGDVRANVDRDRIANELSGNFEVRDRRGRLLNPGQILNGAKSAASASGLSACKVTEASLRGVTDDNNDLWEVACETGPGYVITSPGKSAPVDCSVVATQIAQMKADGLTPPPGSACGLKGNQPKP